MFQQLSAAANEPLWLMLAAGGALLIVVAGFWWWRLVPAQRDAAEPGQVLTEAAVGGFFRVLQGGLAVTTRFALRIRCIAHSSASFDERGAWLRDAPASAKQALP